MTCFPAYSTMSFAQLSCFLRTPPKTPSSRRSSSYASLWLIMSIASSTIKACSECIGVLLSLPSLRSAWFVSRSFRIPACRSIFSCAYHSVPLTRAATVSKIGFGELHRWQVIRLLTGVDCDSASVEFCGVCEIYNTSSKEGNLRALGVGNLTSSFDKTAPGSKVIIPAPLKLAWAFCLVIIFKRVFLKAIKNSFFVIWLIWALIYNSTSRLYAHFKGLKQATSKGWVILDEWRSRKILIMS